MGESRLLHELFATHIKHVQGFFRRRIAGHAEALDLSQEVFLRLLRLQDLHRIEDPQRYLFTVAGNLLKERAQSREQRTAVARVPIEEILDSPELSIEMPADQELDTERQIRRLRSVLALLPVREREVLALVYEERRSYREIARQWGVSRTAVEKTVARAMTRCRRYMNEAGAP